MQAWASAPLVSAIVNKLTLCCLFHSNSPINNQMPPQIIHILGFFLVDSLLQIL